MAISNYNYNHNHNHIFRTCDGSSNEVHTFNFSNLIDNLWRVSGIQVSDMSMDSYDDYATMSTIRSIKMECVVKMDDAISLGTKLELISNGFERKQRHLNSRIKDIEKIDEIVTLSDENEVVKQAWEDLQVLVAMYK